MKLVLIVLLIITNVIAQSSRLIIYPTVGGKYVECTHGDGHWTFVPDEVTNPQASPAGPTGGCTTRPYRQLVAYDDALLNSGYTHQMIVDLVMKAQKRFANALDSSGIKNQAGAIIIDVISVKVANSYSSIFSLKDWIDNPNDGMLDSLLIIKNELLDADHLIFITKEGLPTNEKGVNLQMVNNPNLFFEKKWKLNTGVINISAVISNSSAILGHESGHGVGGAHEIVVGAPPYAQAYVNTTKGVNCIMKGSPGGGTYNRFSGPNSKIIKNGETITLCEDTAVHNASKHISECLDLIWCATENHVTRVSLPATTCGSGKLQAITNNADTFQWKVLSGDCNITGTGQEISYMAMSLTKIQVIGQKKGKWYWDTAVVEIPALQHTNLNSNIKKGEFFILPNKDTVYTSGSYTVTLKNQNGCDSLVTINLSVISSTNKIDQEQIIVFPNPVQEKLFIKKLNEYSHGCIISYSGIKRQVDLSQDEIDVVDLSTGTYIIQLVKGNHILQQKFIKL